MSCATTVHTETLDASVEDISVLDTDSGHSRHSVHTFSKCGHTPGTPTEYVSFTSQSGVQQRTSTTSRSFGHACCPTPAPPHRSFRRQSCYDLPRLPHDARVTSSGGRWACSSPWWPRFRARMPALSQIGSARGKACCRRHHWSGRAMPRGESIGRRGRCRRLSSTRCHASKASPPR